MDNTIIIVTADHGESLGENNYYFEHGMLVNEGSIHIPLIMSHPEIKEPLIIESLLQNTDVFPTLLSEFGIKIPGDIDGIDFSELYKKRKTDAQLRDFIYSCTPHEYENFYETIRTKTGKLIRKDEKEYSFFDINTDRSEENNIFSKIDAALKNDMIKKMETFGKKALETGSKVNLPKEELDALKTLGYIN